MITLCRQMMHSLRVLVWSSSRAAPLWLLQGCGQTLVSLGFARWHGADLRITPEGLRHIAEQTRREIEAIPPRLTAAQRLARAAKLVLQGRAA